MRYASAADEARIGGDLYSVLDTPHGTRVLVGDVRGKGLDAVQTAAVVLGAFREAAYDEPGLRQVATRIEASVERHVPDGEFTTALFGEVRGDGMVELLQYGHVPPLRVAPDGTVTVLDAPDPWVPLGLGRLADGQPQSWHQPFGAGDVLVLCTDGVVEARRRGGGSSIRWSGGWPSWWRAPVARWPSWRRRWAGSTPTCSATPAGTSATTRC